MIGNGNERYVAGSIDRLIERDEVIHFGLVEEFDEYLAEYADGSQGDARRDVPENPSAPEFGQDPVDVVFFFHDHRDEEMRSRCYTRIAGYGAVRIFFWPKNEKRKT